MASIKQTVKAAESIIFGNEGGYRSINPNDNGAVSIGKLQWHGSRALELMRKICSEIGKKQSMLTLGPILYSEIMSPKTKWTTKKFNFLETRLVANILGTTTGKKIQDKLTSDDVLEYITTGMKCGCTNCGTLIYLADAFNQYGIYSDKWRNLAKSVGTDDVNKAFNLTTENPQLFKHRTRRIMVYSAVKKLNISQETIK